MSDFVICNESKRKVLVHVVFLVDGVEDKKGVVGSTLGTVRSWCMNKRKLIYPNAKEVRVLHMKMDTSLPMKVERLTYGSVLRLEPSKSIGVGVKSKYRVVFYELGKDEPLVIDIYANTHSAMCEHLLSILHELGCRLNIKSTQTLFMRGTPTDKVAIINRQSIAYSTWDVTTDNFKIAGCVYKIH